MEISSEESNDTSEEWDDKSEEFFRSSLRNKKYPPRKFEFPRWIFWRANAYRMIWSIGGEGLLPLDKLVGVVSYLYDVGSLW